MITDKIDKYLTEASREEISRWGNILLQPGKEFANLLNYKSMGEEACANCRFHRGPRDYDECVNKKNLEIIKAHVSFKGDITLEVRELGRCPLWRRE